jgi:electron transport complex protein RnfC
MRLMPLEIVRYTKAAKKEALSRYSPDVCIECGICTYVCPARIPVLDYIRRGKGLLSQKEKGGEKK